MSCVGPVSPVGLVINVRLVGGVLDLKGPGSLLSLLSHVRLVSPAGLVITVRCIGGVWSSKGPVSIVCPVGLVITVL